MSEFSMPLNAIGTGKHAIVNKLMGSENMCKKLMEMGVNKGATIEIIRNDSANLLIRVGESRLVIARGMAQKVLVCEA